MNGNLAKLNLLALILAITSCTGNFPISENIPGKEKTDLSALKGINTFSTKELSESYITRKLLFWLNPDDLKGKQLVRELNFARFKYFEELKEIIENDPDIYDAL